MKTLIFDIDGTLTDMWPIEKLILLYMLGTKYEPLIEQLKKSNISDTYKIFLKLSKYKINKKLYFNLYNDAFYTLLKNKKLPLPETYPLILWILKNKNNYHFIYVTGGQKSETLYVLKSLNLLTYFDCESSLDKTTYPFSKKTGLPFRKIKSKFNDCLLISDSKTDCYGATLANIPYILVQSKSSLKNFKFVIRNC